MQIKTLKFKHSGMSEQLEASMHVHRGYGLICLQDAVYVLVFYKKLTTLVSLCRPPRQKGKITLRPLQIVRRVTGTPYNSV